MKGAKVASPSEVCVEMLVASGDVGLGVTLKLCHRVLDGRKMLIDWVLSVVVSIFKRKGDALSSGSCRGIKFIEHAMKVVERVIEKIIGKDTN